MTDLQKYKIRFFIKIIRKNLIMFSIAGLLTIGYLLLVRSNGLTELSAFLTIVYWMFSFFLLFVPLAYSAGALKAMSQRLNYQINYITPNAFRDIKIANIIHKEKGYSYDTTLYKINHRILFYEDIYLQDVFFIDLKQIKSCEYYISKKKRYLKAYINHKTGPIEKEDIIIFSNIENDENSLRSFFSGLTNSKEIAYKELMQKVASSLNE